MAVAAPACMSMPEPTSADRPRPSPLPILWQGGGAVVVEKPVGLAAIAEHAGDAESVHARLQAQLGRSLWIVHRLDKDVSGVLLFAESAVAHRHYCREFEQRRARKTYRAWVHGQPAGGAAEGEIAVALREFGSGRTAPDAERGKPCLTRWRLLRREGPFGLLELEPHTGRRHQLRAHLYAVGCPIVGDPLYGAPELRRGFARLYLHALRLQIAAPDGPALDVAAPLPGHWKPERVG